MTENWYALSVKSQREPFVTEALQSRGFESFLPTYTSRRVWSDRTKSVQIPLFSGYVFTRLDVTRRLPVLQIPGVMSFVGVGREPMALAEQEIHSLQALTQSGELAMPWPYLQVGQRLRIDRGPLRDVEGLLLEVKNRCRLVVSVTLLQRSVSVELDREWITPLGAAHQKAFAKAV